MMRLQKNQMMKKQNRMACKALPTGSQKRLLSRPWSRTQYLSQSGKARLAGLLLASLIRQTIAVTNPQWLSPQYQILFPGLGLKVWT